MPAVVEGSKGRAKLFNTLDRTGAHFIALGSSSSESECDEENVPLSVTETKTAQGTYVQCLPNELCTGRLLSCRRSGGEVVTSVAINSLC